MTTARDTHNQIEYAKEISLEEGLAKGRVKGRAGGGLKKDSRKDMRKVERKDVQKDARKVERMRNNKSRSTCFSWGRHAKSWRRRPDCPWKRLLS